MQELKILFDNNRKWAEKKTAQNPHFFRELAENQDPTYLWIGCSDSRVPANEIVGLEPGEMLVHRNVGGICPHTDFNCLSVIEFAVNILKVRHIIVCGHYGCGGVKAAMEEHKLGLIDIQCAVGNGVFDKANTPGLQQRSGAEAGHVKDMADAGGCKDGDVGEVKDVISNRALYDWLRNIRDVYARHKEELDQIQNPVQRHNRLVELNVIQQVFNICHTTIAQQAWGNGQPLIVHGWVYDLASGKLKDLNLCISGAQQVEAIYRMEMRTGRDSNP